VITKVKVSPRVAMGSVTQTIEIEDSVADHYAAKLAQAGGARSRETRGQRKIERARRAHDLRENGKKPKEIASILGVDASTVSRALNKPRP
jgi:hypothetical protein